MNLFVGMHVPKDCSIYIYICKYLKPYPEANVEDAREVFAHDWEWAFDCPSYDKGNDHNFKQKSMRNNKRT